MAKPLMIYTVSVCRTDVERHYIYATSEDEALGKIKESDSYRVDVAEMDWDSAEVQDERLADQGEIDDYKRGVNG